MHAGGLEGPWVHGFERVAMAAARKEPKHSAEYILSTGVVFSQYLTISSHVCRVNTLLCRRIGRGAEGTSCCEVFSLENHPHRDHCSVTEDVSIGALTNSSVYELKVCFSAVMHKTFLTNCGSACEAIF